MPSVSARRWQVSSRSPSVVNPATRRTLPALRLGQPWPPSSGSRSSFRRILAQVVVGLVGVLAVLVGGLPRQAVAGAGASRPGLPCGVLSGTLGLCGGVGFGLGLPVVWSAGCPPRCGPSFVAAIPLPPRLPPAGFSCPTGVGGGTWLLSGCPCTSGSLPGGASCSRRFCPRGGPSSGALSLVVSSPPSTCGCLGGERPLCVACPFFRRSSTISSTVLWWGLTCDDGLSGCAKAASVTSCCGATFCAGA
ncbi:hypothetical protein CLV71_11811 [Actinophytocola oryzae]|uniref:Uncharacterized protein n=1 Tax=Actinophytocola oryzae TaxID=502181 RepID=A0A4R7V0R3_9PSEU|nr:hypothetical protein CLV71_11811 [Actinophytocola oryzae]